MAQEITEGARRYADDILAALEVKANELAQSVESTLSVLAEAREQLK